MVRRASVPLLALALLAACASVRPGPESLPEPDGDPFVEAHARRRALAERLGPGVVWLLGAEEPSYERFFQHNDVDYLTGVEEPDIAFAMHVGDGHGIVGEALFLPPHDPVDEVWVGPRLAPGPEAAALTGVHEALPLDAQQAWLDATDARTLYVLDEQAARSLPVTPGPDVEVDTTTLRARLADLRWIKSDYEIDCLRNAIAITDQAHRELLDVVEPGAWEFEVQASLEGTFLRMGSERVGFPSICGSGPNSCILHYDANRRRMEAGDLVVIDVGAKFRGYSADVTRTLPVSGRFTPRQREIYEIVLAAHTAAAEAARPGMTLRPELHEVALDVIADAGYGDAFLHGVGHWIGLHVHDLGDLRRPGEERRRRTLEPGTLFTIEPGIYLPDEELGVRIEDCYLMTEDGAVRLSRAPRDPDVLETLMAR